MDGVDSSDSTSGVNDDNILEVTNCPDYEDSTGRMDSATAETARTIEIKKQRCMRENLRHLWGSVFQDPGEVNRTRCDHGVDTADHTDSSDDDLALVVDVQDCPDQESNAIGSETWSARTEHRRTFIDR